MGESPIEVSGIPGCPQVALCHSSLPDGSIYQTLYLLGLAGP